MVRTCRFLVGIALALILLPGISPGQEKTGDLFKGKLFRSLFTTESFTLPNLNEPPYTALSDTLRKRITEYSERRARFVSRIKTPNPPPGFELTVLLENKRIVEKGIYSLASAPNIEEEAAGYAQEAKLYYEWEGMSEGPRIEAEVAETFLQSPVLKPYLLLFILHRYRCAYECLIMEKNTADAQEVSGIYRSYLKLARKSPDPLVRLIAEDMDSVPGNIYNDSRYTGGDVHP